MATKTNSKSVTSKPKRTPVQTKKKFRPSDLIMCHSVSDGGVFMTGKVSKNPYKWFAYGEECPVEYRDLTVEVRSHSKFIYEPWLMVDDEDFIEEFPELKRFYDERYTPEDLREILTLPIRDMKREIRDLPDKAKSQLKDIATSQISSGEVDSLKKIRELSKIFKVDMQSIADLLE